MSKPITIRVPEKVLEKYRNYSEEIGIGYQTIINMTLASNAPKIGKEHHNTNHS